MVESELVITKSDTGGEFSKPASLRREMPPQTEEFGVFQAIRHQCQKCGRGFPIAAAKFCTPDNIALFDKHLGCLEKRGIHETLAETLQRPRNSGEMLSSGLLTKQRLINSLWAEVNESNGLSTALRLPYRTKFLLD
jgi:hypothetical protein